MKDSPRCTAVADHALLVEFATQIDEAAGAAVLSLDRSLRAADPPGMLEVVPAYVSLLIDFDPTVTDHDEIEEAVRHALEAPQLEAPSPRRHLAAVCFDSDLAPDLAAVSESSGLTVQAVIEHFLAGSYRVAMYGFAPGYAYLSGVAEPIQVPRKATPVRNVPAGSVIIAGPQCLITTITMPTGWSVIGRSPTSVHRPHSESPFLFDPGDEVRFERIDRLELEKHEIS